MKQSDKTILFLLVVCLWVLSVPLFALPTHAVLDNPVDFQLDPFTPPPNPIAGQQGTSLNEIKAIVDTVSRFLVVIAVIIAVASIILGGILWMTASDSEDRQKRAKGWMRNGIIGAAIVLGIGVILGTLSNVIARTFFTG